MNQKRYAAAGLCVLLCAAACAALAEPAWVQTEKGRVNVRSKADAKAVIVYRLSNGTQVEVLQAGEEWSRIEYKKKKGYVKTEFLCDTPPATPEPTATPEPVVRKVIQQGGEARIVASGMLNVRKKEDAKSVVVAQVKSGTRVSVVKAMEDWTEISYGGKSGYVQTQYLALDSQMIGKTIYPDGDYLYLRAEASKLSRSLMTVQAAQPMTLCEIGDDWVKVSCQGTDQKPVVGYVYAKEISLWRETPAKDAASFVRAGIQLGTDKLALGEELEVRVVCETGASCSVRILRDGKQVMEEREVNHAVFLYRPRVKGIYQMELIVRKADGTRIGQEAYFTVEETGKKQAAPQVYSQKDGWWLDKKYSRSNLDQSGCAIFALSHALAHLGKSSDKTTPDALAKTYPMYLAESGTVTSNLLAAAGRDFGFKTEKDKVHDAGVIADSLRQGAVCSFAGVNGHIVLAVGLSEDGTKVLVEDSAPSATFERIQNAQVYRKDEQGRYVPVRSPEEFPEAKYYIETGQYGGLSYAMDLDYVAGRGVRLIKP